MNRVTDLVFERVGLKLGSRAVLEGVSLKVAPGDFVALLGPNGAGKTSLIKLGLGLASPSAGRVTLGGASPRELSPRERARRASWLPQAERPSEPVPVIELVSSARYFAGEPHRTSRARAMAALERVGAAALAERSVHELSGGELQRCQLASVLAQGAPLVLVDEPGSHLDPRHQVAIYRLLGELWREGMGILCVTHDVNLLAHVGGDPRIIGLTDGALTLESRFLAPGLAGELSQLYGVRLQALSEGGGRVFHIPAEYDGARP